MALLLGALAAYYVLTVLRFILPVAIPDRLALLLYGGVAYGILQIPGTIVLLALAVAGAATVLMLVTSVLGVSPEPWSWKDHSLHLPVHIRSHRRKVTGIGHVPGAVPPKVGRRIPKIR